MIFPEGVNNTMEWEHLFQRRMLERGLDYSLDDRVSDLHISECFVCMFTYGISIAHQLTKAQNISMIKSKILCGFSCLNPRKKEVV